MILNLHLVKYRNEYIWEVRHSVTLSDIKLFIIKRAIYLYFKC